MLEEFRAAPFVAYRWETPPLTDTTVGQPFECLQHDSAELDGRADPTDFETYFEPDVEVVNFNNLGGDALLIRPCPIAKSANYSHIGAFHRTFRLIRSPTLSGSQEVLAESGVKAFMAEYSRRWRGLAAFASG